jgi:hypothetical protein
MLDFYFLSGLTLIMLHELDAMRCHEWRIFPGLSALPDKLSRNIFIVLHIPLFFWIFQELLEGDMIFRKGFDVFLIIHLIAHLLFLMHSKNEFRDLLSWSIISGAAIFGALDLILVVW